MRYIISRKDSPFIVSNYLKILSGSISQRCDLQRQHLLRYLSFIIGLLLFAANASAQVDSHLQHLISYTLKEKES